MSTGAATSVGALGFSDVRGLAFDPISDTLYGVTSFGTDQLLTINTETGAASAVGPTNITSNIRGLAFAYDPIPEPSRALLSLLGLGAVLMRRRR